MKINILITILFIFCSIAMLYPQEEWKRWQDLEDYMSLFEIEVEAWYNTESYVLNFEDHFSKNLDDTLFQFGYLMEAFEFMLIDLDIDFEELHLDVIIYSYIDDRAKHDIHMESDMLIDYFDAGPRERQKMLNNLVESQMQDLFSAGY